MILATVALAFLMECELPAWLVDQAGAIRDSADVVLEATVIGLRYEPDPESVPAHHPVLIHTFDCGPQLYFGGLYVIGLKNWEGSTSALAAVSRREADSLIHQLGGSLLPEEVDDGSGGSLAPLVAALLALLFAAGVYGLLQRRDARRN